MKDFFKKVKTKIKSLFESKGDYLSYAEQKEILKSNRKIVKEFEKNKKRKDIPESEYLTVMNDPENIVEFDGLKTYFYTERGVVKSVDGVSFSIPKNTTVGVVGESGCGKSVTSLSLMRLVQGPAGQIAGGSIRFAASNDKAYDIVKMPLNKMNTIRGKDITMIFQEPMTSLNPVFNVGNQLDEVVLLHEEGSTKITAKERTLQMLKQVGIAMPEKVYKQYPHELSGGMRQRVMIAMALICNPKLIIADEPTTALDVTIQAQILDLFREIKHKLNGSIMLITHDLGVIAEMADYVVVMYAGRIIEKGTVKEIFADPRHPYTAGLQKSKPSVDKITEWLYNIPGQVPSPVEMPSCCYFKDRCDKCGDKCGGEYPPEFKISDTHYVSCYYGAERKFEEKEPAISESKPEAAIEEEIKEAVTSEVKDISAAIKPEQTTDGADTEKAMNAKKPAGNKKPASAKAPAATKAPAAAKKPAATKKPVSANADDTPDEKKGGV